MSKAPAPAGAFLAPAHQPAITLNRAPQGSTQSIDGSVIAIARAIKALFPFEKEISAWAAQKSFKGKRLAPVDGKLKWVPVAELVGDSLRLAIKRRDDHLAQLQDMIDFHLSHVAFVTVRCPTCRLPADPVKFALAVPAFERPHGQCTTCKGLGTVQQKKIDQQSVEDADLVTYWKSVLDDYARCCKIKAGSPGRDEAYLELEAANATLLKKFGNEQQTSLEGADAEQGVRQGLIDAAVRFNPLKKKDGKYAKASFSTVAYNWCRRNSRARQTGQKRAGVYAPSIETLGGKKWNDGEGGSGADLIQSADGALGTLSPATDVSPLVLDLREKVEELPGLQRDVVMAELSGMSTGEISTKLDITKVKVRKLREQAFGTLRKTLVGYVSVLHD